MDYITEETTTLEPIITTNYFEDITDSSSSIFIKEDFPIANGYGDFHFFTLGNLMALITFLFITDAYDNLFSYFGTFRYLLNYMPGLIPSVLLGMFRSAKTLPEAEEKSPTITDKVNLDKMMNILEEAITKYQKSS